VYCLLHLENGIPDLKEPLSTAKTKPESGVGSCGIFICAIKRGK
jgi:hypothetical protein